jgi:RNA polymerase sigma-70 factor (ECF subfamily)
MTDGSESSEGCPFVLSRLYTLSKVLIRREEPSKDSQRSELTLLLNRMGQGDQIAAGQAVALVYDELHRIASFHMKRERRDHTLQTTALVHEAYVKLVGAAPEIQNRGHFFAIASQQMRRILVDHARTIKAGKRGGGAVKIALDSVPLRAAQDNVVDVLLLDETLKVLERLDPRAAKVVELRFFGGYTDKEVVEGLGVSLATIRRDWEYARSWLFDRMKRSTSA